MRGLAKCNCASHGLGALGDIDTVTVTAPAIPCTDLYRNYYNSGSKIDLIKYNLCLAEHKMGQWALDAWHWAWGELDWLWQQLGHVTRSIGTGIVQAGAWAGHATVAAVDKLWDATKNFMGKVSNGFKSAVQAAGIFTLLGIAGGIWLLSNLFHHGAEVSSPYGTLRVGHRSRK